MKEEVTLNRKEQNRLVVMNQIEGRKLTVDKAATLLELSPPHVWRMLTAYRKEGASALAHGNRGRKPINTIEEGLRQQIVELAGTSITDSISSISPRNWRIKRG